MARQPEWEDRIIHKKVKTADEVSISYMSLGEGTEDVVAFANGLGGRLYSFEPIVNALAPAHRILTWDYRGLFESGSPRRIRNLSIPNHARDLKAIMDAEGISKVHLIGWSMGVQVALEFATLYPENLDRMVLINGTYGRALMTGFQPIVRIPGFDLLLHRLIDTLREHPSIARTVSRAGRSRLLIEPLGTLYSFLRGNPRIKDILDIYLNDVLGESFPNYLRLFQELDAHYSYHHLKYIPHQTLIVYGLLDFLTPAYQSRAMKKKLRNVQSLRLMLGTHFAHLEYPHKVPHRIAEFLAYR
ncbi:MAG: alpha/beta hydrolase [Thermodesulfobacteriota bacterium]